MTRVARRGHQPPWAPPALPVVQSGVLHAWGGEAGDAVAVRTTCSTRPEQGSRAAGGRSCEYHCARVPFRRRTPRSPGTHCDGVPSGGGDGWPNACVLFASSFGSQRSSGQSGFRDRQQGLLQLPQPRATPGEDCVPTSGSLLFVATAPRLLEPNCSFCASPTSSTRARRGRMDRIGTQAKSSMTTSRIFPSRTSR